jgi:DNA-binding SARP family transcriptional activator/class 3 adenylate cyclase/WD40 repeat protein
MGDAPPTVQVRVLGPFEVLVDGRPAPLGGARQRLVLAGLVASANAVVPSDRMIDIVWGDEPPDTALSTLQKYVHRLRASLGDRLLTRAPGYLLRVEAGESDASRFEALLADAAELTTAGELSEAKATFDTALALWRGPAWAEFAEFDFARPEVARLEGLRAAAIEDRAEVALAGGHHAEVIGELEGTVARYPLRERPRAQLMLALHRSGRHADALRAYDAFRHYLGEEVGLEPSASLAQLADAIVLQKPELDWVPPPGSRGRAALPSGVVTFLFSDIEGSTRLFRQLGHNYVELLERHRRLVRAAVATQGGVEVNSEGDGLFFAFASAAAALGASVAAQQALVSEEWPSGVDVRVRMGLHTGVATPHDGDYIALAVHQAARVKVAAHGGQVLLSHATVAAIDAAMPDGCSVIGLGTYPLTDFDQGVELFEARHPSLPDAFPPPRVGPRVPVVTPLPAVLAADHEALVGRTSDLDWLEVLWQRAVAGEPVTALVHGPPGIGKSRLLAEFARRAHSGGATVSLSALEGRRIGGEPVLVVLDDFDGTSTGALDPGAGVLALAASRHLIAGDPNTRELRGLSSDEVGALLAQKLATVTPDLADAVHTETEGNPGRVHDVACRLRDREAEERVQRALARVGTVAYEARALSDEIAGGVLRRERVAARTPQGVVLGVCPYKGLARYEAADAAFFHGRERLVARLVARLAIDRFVGIVGASGSGKSSLVRAGLLPALSARALPGSDAWPTCTCTPGEHPMRQFAAALAPLAGVPAPELAHRLDRQPDELGAVVGEAVRGRDGARVVVVVDQFEEVATLCRDRDERERFAGALVDAVSDPDIPVVLVAVVRADYYGTLTTHPELPRLFESSHLLVGAMSDAELGRAITEPARRAGLVLEDWLAEAVCADAGSEPGALPLVSTAMAETWVRREGAALTLAGYRQAGGVHGAVARLADHVFGDLDPDGQALARRLFLRLAEQGEGNDDLRRRMPRAEFGGDDETDAVLDAFVDRRLLVADAESVEVAHEALLREWPRVRTWLEEDREGRRLHRQLTEATSGWASEGRDPAALYRGSRLVAAEEWSAAHPGDANPLERDFLDTSLAAQDAALQAARRSARRLRRLTVGVTAVAAVALVAGGLALAQRNRADHQTAAARRAAIDSVAGRLAAQARSLSASQLDLAMLLAVQSRHLEESTATDGALETVLVNTPPGLDRIVQLGAPAGCGQVSVDGRFAAGATVDGYTHLIDVSSGQTLRTLPNVVGSKSCASLAFSTDGNRLIASGTTGDAVVWDTATGQQIGAVIKVPPPSVKGVIEDAFEPRPGRLVTSIPGGVVTLWDTTDPPHPSRVAMFGESTIPGSPSPLVQLADPHNPDRIAVGTLAGTHVWDIITHTLAYPTLPGLPVAESPDGSTLVTATPTQFLLWDVTTGRPRGDPLSGITPAAFHPAFFSPNGTRLAVEDSATASAVVVDLATRRRLLSVPVTGFGGPGPFLADGRLSVFAGQTMTLWRVGVTSPAPFATRLGAPGSSYDSLFTPDGSKVITVGPTGLHTWDPTTGAPLAPLLGGRLDTAQTAPPPPTATFSADGSLLAWSPGDGTVTLWDLATGQRVGALDTGALQALLTWAPRGRALVVATPGGAMTAWNLADPEHPVRLARMTAPGFPAGATPGPLFSPDGRLLAAEPLPSSGTAGYFPVSIFDASRGKLLRTLQPNAGVVRAAAFSPDSQTLGALVWDQGSSTGRVVLYDVPTGRSRGTLFLPYISDSVAFVAGGRWLATSEFNLSFLTNGSPLGRFDLWDRATLLPIGEPLSIPGSASSLATDQPGGYRITTATGWPAGTPTVLDLDPSHWEATACRLAGRNLTRAEWAQYIPGLPYQTTCPQWPASA